MFNKFLSTRINEWVNIDVSILLLRVGAGAFILTHGFPKVMNVISGTFRFGDPLGLGPELSLILSAFAEGICGLLLIFGVGTRLVTIPLIINMAVAVFFAHAGDPFGRKEKAVLFLLLFVFLFLTGGGKYSLDQKLSGDKENIPL